MADTLGVSWCELEGMRFSVYSSEELLKMSVKEITNSQSFDALMHPTHGGLYDPALGPTERDDVCETCGLNSMHCPGHMSHIKLPLVVYHPVFLKIMFSLLKRTCLSCQQLVAERAELMLLSCQLQLLEHSLISVVDELSDIYRDIVEEHGSSRGQEQQIEDRLKDCVQAALQDNSDTQYRHEFQVKHIQEYRSKIIQEFLRKNSKRCPHCDTVQRQLRLEHNSKIFFHIPKRKAKPRVKLPNANQSVQNGGGNNNDKNEKEKEENTEAEVSESEGQVYLTPHKIRNIFRQLWLNEDEVLPMLFGTLNVKNHKADHPTDIFFLELLPVPPPRFRPVARLGDKSFENAQTANLSKVLVDCQQVKEVLFAMQKKDATVQEDLPENTTKLNALEVIPGQTLVEKLQNAWIRLQVHVNCAFDSDMDKLNKEKHPGIKQLLEKKEGLFRMHMMGKRVNYAARSVISPDPYLATNEIGIPYVFAKKLTYPQPVTPWNFHELKQAVINGPKQHPGATHVEFENGFKTILSESNKTQREAVAKQLLTPSANAANCMGTKKVYRHVKNGDILLLNRQPTLHRPSIQAHKARILPSEKTLRLHYANCKAYNADFDGDEMNAHFPQDEIARAEAYTIACTDFQYLVPKDGSPLAGLIQDHMVSGVMLTIRGRHFERGDYQQLVFNGLTSKRGPVKFLPPVIRKPKVLWSGKQVLSTLLLNIIPEGKPPLNLDGRAKIAEKNWRNERGSPWAENLFSQEMMGESDVVIRRGELLVGVLDKGHYGNTPYGLVHCCYELYGGETAGKLLTCLARLFTFFLQYRGFTLGVEDILCTKSADDRRAGVVAGALECGDAVARQALQMSESADKRAIHDAMQQAQFAKDDAQVKDMDLCMKGKTDEIQNQIAKICMPLGLEKRFPYNNLQLMVQSGAKGSSVNCMQISCLLGQIELEGRRPPTMLSGKPLPSFQHYETMPRAGGFVAGRFLTGIRPQEYFFHCMAGREGLVDTAVKTSRSGYLQRCIIKHLEGLTVGYDLTVRDSDASIVQFQYGEDGLEIAKTKFLTKKQFPFLINNKHVFKADHQLKNIKKTLDSEQALSMWEKVKKWKKKAPKKDKVLHSGPFYKFSKKQSSSVAEDVGTSGEGQSKRREVYNKLCQLWRDLEDGKRKKYTKYHISPDPVMSRLAPSRNLGSISETMEELIDDYVKRDPDNLIWQSDAKCPKNHPKYIERNRLRELLYYLNMKALAEPGEAVGLVAAQSIGEPSTQMTLNTFHFAGRGEMNVTLGIPRLREILMVASANIKTPSMDVMVHNTEQAHQEAKKLKKKLTQVKLKDVMKDVSITETINVKNKVEKGRLYRIRFNFLRRHVYKEQFCVSPAGILRYMETKFLEYLLNQIKRAIVAMQSSSLLHSSVVRESSMYHMKSKDNEGDKDKDQPAPTEDDGSDEEDMNDDDATATKARDKHNEELGYEGEEEEREEIGGEDESDDEGLGDESQNAEGSEDEDGEETVEHQEYANVHRKKKDSQMSDIRINAVLSSIAEAVEYKYDANKELWCEVVFKFDLSSRRIDVTSLIEKLAERAVIHEVPSIIRCFLSESKKPGEEGRLRIKTEGCNLKAMFKYDDILDLNQLYTNDIHAVYNTYGIEAAVRVIVKEIRDVFAAYGIEVDYRHLSLVADYMTFEGKYKPFNRAAIDSNPSPLQKMTFETTMNFLKLATVQGSHDDLMSPSSRLVVGKLVAGGTGAFDINIPLDKDMAVS